MQDESSRPLSGNLFSLHEKEEKEAQREPFSSPIGESIFSTQKNFM